MNTVLTYEALKAERDALAVENAALKSAVTAKAYIDFIESNGWNAGVKTINGKFAGFMDPEVDFGSMTFEHAKKLIDAVETPVTDAALAAIEARGVEKALAVVSACRENICPGGLSENRQYEESIVHPHLDGISDELESFVAELREAK